MRNLSENQLLRLYISYVGYRENLKNNEKQLTVVEYYEATKKLKGNFR